MIPRTEDWSIVIVGHWNRMIFTPEWVGERLFQQEVVETQIALLPIFPVIYRHDQVVFEVSSSRLSFRPRFNSNDALETTEKMAITVLNELPITPISGIGVNFAFSEQDPSIEIVKIFNFIDNSRISMQNIDITESKLTRKLRSNEGIINLSLDYDDEEGCLGIDLNFHTDLHGKPNEVSKMAQKAIEGRIVKLRDVTLEFLCSAYDLRVESSDNNE